jgi:hypothetical protein
MRLVECRRSNSAIKFSMRENARPQKSRCRQPRRAFQAVWAKPMTKLAEEYGIGGNGLEKVCRRLQVPNPINYGTEIGCI